VFAAYTAEILDYPSLAKQMSRAAALRAKRYTWTAAAGRLRRLYMDLTADRLVDCM
jgi:glycosyltransferase involved in cell wall biosynthesis